VKDENNFKFLKTFKQNHRQFTSANLQLIYSQFAIEFATKLSVAKKSITYLHSASFFKDATTSNENDLWFAYLNQPLQCVYARYSNREFTQS
jgi:hypothetical protein